MQLWVIKRELGFLVANDILPGFHFSDVVCGLVLEINKPCGQSVSSPQDPGADVCCSQ